MFTIEDREHIREQIIAKARSDPRLVAAAAVGSSAGQGDRWSDLDFTFGVAEHASIDDVLTDWTEILRGGFDAVVLFDLPFLSTIYRVFLLPGMLQVDLSFTPAADFGARGPRFKLLFGEAVERPFTPPPSPESIFGLGVHYAHRAYVCIGRGQLWQAEYLIHGARDHALTLACLNRGLAASYGRGFDQLPAEVLDSLADAFVAGITVEELRRALAPVIAALLREAGHILDQSASWFRPQLEELCPPFSS
jgi:hypothetical protein